MNLVIFKMRNLRSIIALLLILLLLSCRHTMTAKELNEYFYLKKPQLDQLVHQLEKDKQLESLFKIAPGSSLPDIKKEYPSAYHILKECGITHASSHGGRWGNWYYFETDWAAEAPILLSYSSGILHDDKEQIKGFYKTDEYLNEWWGLGEGWQMLKLVKEIDYIKQ